MNLEPPIDAMSYFLPPSKVNYYLTPICKAIPEHRHTLGVLISNKDMACIEISLW